MLNTFLYCYFMVFESVFLFPFTCRLQVTHGSRWGVTISEFYRKRNIQTFSLKQVLGKVLLVSGWGFFLFAHSLAFKKENKIKNIDHVGFVFKIQVNKNFDFKFDQWGIVKYLFVVHVKPTIKMKLRKNMYQMVLCFHSHRWEEKYQERRKWWSIYT